MKPIKKLKKKREIVMRARLSYGKHKFDLDLEVVSGLKRAFGLMFTSRKKAKPLLFNFKKQTNMAIHSLFVFFPFLAIWLDEDNRIIEFRKVNPFTFSVSPSRPYNKLIEVPLNGQHPGILGILVDYRKI